MFTSNSRYAKVSTAEVETKKGATAQAVKLRRLPATGGDLTEVKGNDRLDIIAHRKYSDDTKFWHIADANTELEAAALVKSSRSENPLARQETRFILEPES